MSLHFTPPIMPSKTRWFVLVRFFWLNGWQVAFFDENQHTQLPLELTFARAEKLVELYEKWGVAKTMEARRNLDVAIELGRKGQFLININQEQYRKLKVAKRR